jgi:ubiquinol-cytochrome c reductase cytochrome c subunit
MAGPRRRSRVAPLAVLLLGLLVTGSLSAAFAARTKPAEAAPAPAADAVAEGRALFLANCSTCHGRNAEGTSDGPSLIGVGAAAVDFQVATGRMPLAQQGPQAPRGRILFNQDQINKMAAYVASLGPGPAIPAPEQYAYEGLSAEEIAEGGEIYRTNCSMCHNFAGAGGALTRGKYAPALQGVDPRHIYEAMLTGPQSMPVFADSTLPPEDKRKIIGFLKSIEEEPKVGGATLGQLGPVSEGLVGWLVGLGALIAGAVWLGAKST